MHFITDLTLKHMGIGGGTHQNCDGKRPWILSKKMFGKNRRLEKREQYQSV
jgi:hypothetical protein